MKTTAKLFVFPCACEKQQSLEKVLRVKDIPKPKAPGEPVEVDVYCHWCGKYIMVPISEELGTDTTLRE